MVQMIVEFLVVVSSVFAATVVLKKDPAAVRKTFAVSFVLAVAVLIAFAVAQAGAQFGLLDLSLAYTPLDVLALLAVIYWVAIAAAKGTVFDRLVGEAKG